MLCTYCSSENTVYNDSRGESICTDCGAVLNQSAMVDQLNFTSDGTMTGQFYNKNSDYKFSSSIYDFNNSSESALARGWNNLERVADRLKISSLCIEAAKRLYRLALQRNFTIGRNNYFVVSACLYVVCRKEKASHLLIDFSDALQTPVKILAQIYMKLTKALCLEVPSIDPSLFMERFAKEMNLGISTNQVAQTAVKLVQAMTRDWMVTGRRPAGLCAVALLVAASYHKISLSSDEIYSLFRISSSTIEKRLREFKKTALASLKVKQFESIDLLKIQNNAEPPCLISKKRKLKNCTANSFVQPLDYKTTENDITMILQAAVLNDSKEESSLLGRLALENVGTMNQICQNQLQLKDASEMSLGLVRTLKDTFSNAENVPKNKFNKTLYDISLKADSIMNQVIEPLSNDMSKSNQDDTHIVPNDYSQSSLGNNVVIKQSNEPIFDDEFEFSDDSSNSSLNEIDDQALDCFMLNPQDRSAKEQIWNDLTRDMMPNIQLKIRTKKKPSYTDSSQSSGGKKRLAIENIESMTEVDSVKVGLNKTRQILKTKLNEEALNALFT